MISMCRRVLEGLVKRGILLIIRIWLLELRERHVMDKYSAMIWVYFGHIQWMFFWIYPMLYFGKSPIVVTPNCEHVLCSGRQPAAC